MKFENIRVMNFENALCGMRNPKESWSLSDSYFGFESADNVSERTNGQDYQILHRDGDIVEFASIGPNDMKLAQQLIKAGSEHRKFMRQIFVSVDITAPIYWWKEFDTYKVGTVANSTSTMHKLMSKPITIDCFEIDDFNNIEYPEEFQRKELKYPVDKSKGVSTIGGKSIWFDPDINRLNEDAHGILLGEFHSNDQILAICKNGNFYTTNFDLSNRYQGDILKIEKLDSQKTYSAIYFDGESKDFYIKRFSFEPSINIVSLFISEAPGSYFVEISDDTYPQVLIKFGGKHEKRQEEIIDVEQFIGKKGFKAKGKKATTFEVASIQFIEPLQKEESMPEGGDEATENPTDNTSQESYSIGDSVDMTLF